MGYKEFEIILDSPVYYAGQNLTGKLLVELKKPKKFKGLYLKYFGKGIVHWAEGWGSTMMPHSNMEVYFTQYQLVFGNESEPCELNEGRHVFNFNCQLPSNLPCSFEGIFGRITYSIKALIDRPLKNDYVAKQSFTVVSIFDLNRCSFASMPIAEQTGKTFWGHSKPLFMSVNLPVRGFVPGQIIPIKVLLNNESKVQIKSVSASLKQRVVFHAIKKSTTVKMFLFKSDFSVEESFGRNEIHLNIKIPALPPSYLQFCKIIDLRYQLNVKAKVSGYHRSLKIPIEVIIGNIPLMNYELPIPGQQLLRGIPYNIITPDTLCNYGSDYQPPPYSIDFPPSAMYEDLPPPSYEESIRLRRPEEEGSSENDPDDQDIERTYSPLYPIYKFETNVNELNVNENI